jgi:type I restriction enzyme, S subunit
MSTTKTSAQVPKLRFPGFTDEWIASTLGAVMDYTKGFAFKSEDYRTSGIRIVRVSDLAARHIKENNANVYIDDLRSGEFQKWAIKSSEIVITTVGSRPELVDSAVGRGIFVDSDSVGFLNQNMLKLGSINGNAPRFIFGQLNTPKYVEFITQIKRGNANQANITVQDLMRYEVFVTNSDEQQKIAAFLTAVDGRIEQLSRKKALLEAYKKGVMQQLFTQTLRFQDDHGHDFPDWEEKTVGDVCSVVTSGSRDWAQYYSEEGAKFVRMTNLARNGIYLLLDDMKYVSLPQGGHEGARTSLQGHDILISITAELGKIGWVPEGFGEAYINQHTALVRPVRQIVDSKYLAYVLATPDSHKRLNRLNDAGAKAGLNLATIREFELPVPSLPEQTKIAGFLSALDGKIGAVGEQMRQTQAWKKGLLQQMFV